MICLRPMSVPLRKSAGVVAEKTDGERQTIPCGKCAACLSNRRKEWAYRLLEEQKNHVKSVFLTLTYNDKNLIYGSSDLPVISVRDVQLYIKSIRKAFATTHRKIRHYSVGEYGSKTNRPHYHCIIFNASINDYDILNEKWGKGNIFVGDVTIRSIMYVAKYHVNKTKHPPSTAPPFVLMSRRPGIGNSYIEKYRKWHEKTTENMFYPDYEKKVRLPRYYKKALYSKEQIKEYSEKFVDYAKEQIEIEKYNRTHKHSFFRNQFDAIQDFERQFKEKSIVNDKL